MKRYLYFLVIICLLLPLPVLAEDMCNDSEVKIKNLELVNTTGLANEKDDATLRNNKIETDVEMYEVGDSITYQFTVDNKSNNEYAIDASDLVDPNNHIEYTLDSEDHSNKIKKKSTKDFTLTATYENEITSEEFQKGVYDAGTNVVLQVKDPALINPLTGNFFYYMIILILVICVLFGIKIKSNLLSTLSLLGLFLIPIGTYAYCQLNMEVDFNVEVQMVVPNNCTYDGEMVANAEYVNGQYTYTFRDRFYDDYTGQYYDGWAVTLTDKDSTAPVTSKLCTSINDKPIISMVEMFRNSKTTSVDTSSFDTSNVISTWGMFYGASSIKTLDVHNFDTSRDSNFGCMFENMTSLEEIDIRNFDVSKTTNLGYLFDGDTSLKTLDLSGLNTSRVTTMYGVCGGCTSLESIDLSGWDFRSYNSSGLFTSNLLRNTTSLKTINLTGAKIKNLNWAFENMSSLEEVIFDNVETTENTTVRNMFYGCSNIESLDLSDMDTSNVTDFSYAFMGTSSLTNLDISTWNSSKVTYMTEMFRGTGLSSLDLSHFDVSNVNGFSDMFKDTPNLTDLNLNTWVFKQAGSLLAGNNSIVNLSMKYVKPCSGTYFFPNLRLSNTVEVLDVTGWDISGLTSLSSYFYNYSTDNNLTTIKGLNTWDVSNIGDYSYTFSNLPNLKNINISNWNPRNATNAYAMFKGDSGIETIDLSSFDFSHLSYAGNSDYMFEGCTSVTNAYGRSSSDNELLNASKNKASNVNFVIKS